MYRKKIKTPFGYAPVSLNFDCFLIFYISVWLLEQSFFREYECNNHCHVVRQSLESYIKSVYDLYFDLVVK